MRSPRAALRVFVETWPENDREDQVLHELSRLRERIAFHVAQTVEQAGMYALLLTRNHSGAKRLPGNSLNVFVRWGNGVLLTAADVSGMGQAASDGRVWGNCHQDAGVWAFRGPAWPDLRSPPQALFPATAATLFRLETGGDLCLLAALEPDLCGQEASSLVEPPATQNVLSAMGLMTKRTGELLVIGDPGSERWQYLEHDTACRVRLLADSRGGMLASLLASTGPRRFVQYLAELGDAALVNSRILFCAADYPNSRDFFCSDTARVQHISHAGLRELTEEMLSSTQPMVLGGSSLLNGGIYFLVERAWQTQDLARQFSIINA